MFMFSADQIRSIEDLLPPAQPNFAAAYLQAAADAGVLGQHVECRPHDDHQQHGDGQDAEQAPAADEEEGGIEAARRGVAVRQHQAGRDRLARGRDELEAGQQEVHRERGEQVRHLEPQDQRAVEQADRGAEGQRQEDGREGGAVPQRP